MMGAQDGRMSGLPTNAAMAETLRGGEPIADLAARLGVTVQRVRSRLNDAGWGQNGHPMHALPPRRALIPSAQPWELDALCAQTDPEVFFPDKGGSVRAAKSICRECPVRLACLEDALASDYRWGVRGGLSERERRKLRKAAS